MAPRSTSQTGSQRKLGGNARSFLSRYSVPDQRPISESRSFSILDGAHARRSSPEEATDQRILNSLGQTDSKILLNRNKTPKNNRQICWWIIPAYKSDVIYSNENHFRPSIFAEVEQLFATDGPNQLISSINDAAMSCPVLQDSFPHPIHPFIQLNSTSHSVDDG